MASTFGCEIWVKPESARNSTTSRNSETKPPTVTSNQPASPPAQKKHNLLYRIFHLGEEESTPSSSSSPFSSIFNRLNQDADSDSEVEDKPKPPPLLRRGSSQASSRKSSIAIPKTEDDSPSKSASLPRKKNTFNFNSDSGMR